MKLVTNSQVESLLAINEEVTQYLVSHGLQRILADNNKRLHFANLLARQDNIIRRVFDPKSLATESLQQRVKRAKDEKLIRRWNNGKKRQKKQDKER